MALVEESARELGVKATCTALGVPRASYYRARRPRPERKPRPKPARALATEERSEVLAVLHEPRFVDLAPAEIYACLLDEGTYLCSERTFYRILADAAEVRERRAQQPSALRGSRAAGDGTEPAVVVGYHATPRSAEADLLLPLRAPRHLQPVRGRLAPGG